MKISAQRFIRSSTRRRSEMNVSADIIDPDDIIRKGLEEWDKLRKRDLNAGVHGKKVVE